MADLGVRGTGPDAIKVSLYHDPAGTQGALADFFWRPAFSPPGEPLAENIEVRATSPDAPDTLTLRGDFTEQDSWLLVEFTNDDPVTRNLHVVSVEANGTNFFSGDRGIWGNYGENFFVKVTGDAPAGPDPEPEPEPEPVPGAVFRGTTRADTVQGGVGDDTLFGLGGDDLLRGGPGNDVINAGPGNDTVEAGAGNDTINGASGVDTVLFVDGEGDDVFSDFEPGQDLVLLQEGSEGFELAAATRGGVSGSVLSFGEGSLGSLFLPNVAPSDLAFHTVLL